MSSDSSDISGDAGATRRLPPPPPPPPTPPDGSDESPWDRARRATTGWWVLLPAAVLGALLALLLPLASLEDPDATAFSPGIVGFEFLGTTAQVVPDPPEPPTEADCLAQVEVTPACRLILDGEPIVDVTEEPPRVAWVDAYSDGEVGAALLWDMPVILVYVALLALLARTGCNYRTVSTRRLAPKLMWFAVAAGVLDLVENLFIWLAANDAGAGGQWAWRVAAAATWGKWLLVLMVALYGAGGVLSLLLDRRVRGVLETAAVSEARGQPGGDAAAWTVAEHQGPRTLGIAISGGGIRAASISLGALQSLERGHPLGWDSAADITSVSGGSYMAGGWSLARHAPGAPGSGPRPWSWTEADRPGPEERHLEANLGYLLSNAPRGISQDRMMREEAPAPVPVASAAAGPEAGVGEPAPDPYVHDRKVAERRPAVVSTVLTGMAINAVVFLAMLWVLSQPLGWFYRWYFALGCPPLQERAQATADLAYCLPSLSRTVPSVLIWLGVGIGAILVWVVLAKRNELNRRGGESPPGFLLVLKVLGYGGLGLAALLGLLLVGLPLLISGLWAPVEGNGLGAALLAILGALGSAGALFRILRKPLARFAPVIAGSLFALLLLFITSNWALSALAAAPDARATTLWIAAIVGLLVVHFGTSVEWWSLSAFYRGKLRAAFATYRPTPDSSYALAYANGNEGSSARSAEPDLMTLTSSPLTVCAAASVSGREVRTHYGIPALSMTFSPNHVRLFAPLTGEGEWRTYAARTEDMSTLMAGNRRPRLTTMLAVGISGAAVSPAMGRIGAGPLSMLLAFANVRLGMWVPNPRYAAQLVAEGVTLPSPRLGYLLKEFLGLHDPSDLYLYVTDGGHWENTALVELLRTGLHREIVCIDADAGPGHRVASLSKAIDLAKLECNATVVVNLDTLRAARDPYPGQDYSPRSVTLGIVHRQVRHPDALVADAEHHFTLLWYCKPALTQDMPPKLLAYREIDESFPRVNTVNQFFHTAQFAAYRDLGRYNAGQIQVARERLRDAVTPHLIYPHFRAAVLGDQDPDEDDWAPTELVDLIDKLVLARPSTQRDEYADRVYDEVRGTLLSAP